MNRIAPQTYVLITAFIWAFGWVFANAPILQTGYQPVPAPPGETARLMFNEKEYALAHAWAAIRQNDGPRAAVYAHRSLAAAPENAYGWLALAWAEALSGQDEAGIAALERSYELAPRSMPLAVSRVALAQRWWPRLSLDQRKALLGEVKIARGLNAHAFNQAAAEAPRLAILHRMARAE